MDKQKIYELAEDILQEFTNCYCEEDKDCLVSIIRKYIPENAVVLTRDNYNRLKRDSELYEARHEEKLKLFAKAYNQGSKETAEKFAEKFKEKMAEVWGGLGKIPTIEFAIIDEICEEITKGESNANK